MVKKIVFLLVIFNITLFANEVLLQQVQSFLDRDVYEKNRDYIKILFSDEEKFYNKHTANSNSEKIDDVRIVETLKENGLLELFFTTPQKINISFSSNSNALFFVKLMNDTLRSMGYYRYITDSAELNSANFVWKISLTSEYIMDPLLLQKALQKRGCDIQDITRISQNNWVYKINTHKAHLRSPKIHSGEEITLKRSQNREWWIDISEVKKLTLTSETGNNWYPNITFYSKTLKILRVYKRDSKTWQIALRLPKDSFYIKISDLYTIKNMKNGLRVEAEGIR